MYKSRTFVSENYRIHIPVGKMKTAVVIHCWFFIFFFLVSNPAESKAYHGYKELVSNQAQPNVEQGLKESGPQYWADQAQAQATLQQAINSKRNEGVAKNIIFFLGDGMSIPTITASRIYRGQKNGKPGEETVLTFETFPDVALIKTYNTDFTVPDSAGTATAFLCGVKSKMGTIGVDERAIRHVCSTQNGTELTSVLQWAQEAGKDTGVITNEKITHATPAGTYAQTVSRDWQSDSDKPENAEACPDIALQLIEGTPGKNIKVILAGGRSNLMPNTESDPVGGQSGQRQDGRNLINEWQASKAGSNFTYFINNQEFDRWDTATTDYAMGLFAYDHMEYNVDRDPGPNGQPSLAEMTRKAIGQLSKSTNGYFLFVEGGKIDSAHHANNPARALEETLALDEAIQTAVNITSESDTLIIVTADHAHTMTINGYPPRGHPILGKAYVSDVDFLPYTTLMYTNGPGNPGNLPERPNLVGVDTENIDYISWSAVPTKGETHGGDDVALFARGPMSYLFHGVLEQNYIPHALAYAGCFGINPGHCTRN